MTAQTGWVPTAGARALVAVAETPAGSPCESVHAGDEVTVRSHLTSRHGQGFNVSTDDGRWGWIAARHLRPVPVAPAPDQDDQPERQWRVGGSYNLHAYADEPWDVDPSKDRPVATFHRPADAALAVSRVNAHATLTARAEQAEAEVVRLRREAGAEGFRLGAAEHNARLYKSQRDAARAELAAANTTDGLGLPEVEVADVYERTVSFSDGKVLRLPEGNDAGPYINQQAAYWLALARLDHRLRLAQEAPTTKDEE